MASSTETPNLNSWDMIGSRPGVVQAIAAVTSSLPQSQAAGLAYPYTPFPGGRGRNLLWPQLQPRRRSMRPQTIFCSEIMPQPLALDADLYS